MSTPILLTKITYSDTTPEPILPIDVQTEKSNLPVRRRLDLPKVNILSLSFNATNCCLNHSYKSHCGSYLFCHKLTSWFSLIRYILWIPTQHMSTPLDRTGAAELSKPESSMQVLRDASSFKDSVHLLSRSNISTIGSRSISRIQEWEVFTLDVGLFCSRCVVSPHVQRRTWHVAWMDRDVQILKNHLYTC